MGAGKHAPRFGARRVVLKSMEVASENLTPFHWPGQHGTVQLTLMRPSLSFDSWTTPVSPECVRKVA